MLQHSPHLALYRKYRPQTFDVVVGQDKIVDLLQVSIKQNKISHAYLFCGGRGTGKTTVARIFARDIGCNPEDIIEIDAASNRGIDEIRELRDAVRTMPFSSPYKVYIIDEVHMLTKEAANALLKTLEEPPSHVIFILATTDPDKLPQTIVSRCQKLIFSSPSNEILAKQLSYVAGKEGKDIDEATAMLIAAHGDGSYRDALGVLEQVLTSSTKKITHDSVMVYLGVTKDELVLELIKSICSKDNDTLLNLFEELEKGHYSPHKVYDDLIEMLRQGLLIRVRGKENIDDTKKALSLIAKEYPYVLSSKTILHLLTKRDILAVSTRTSWTAFQAVMIELVEGGA